MASNDMATASPVEIRRAGFRALCETLGPEAALRFILEYDTGRGNYVEERKRIFRKATFEQLGARLKRLSAKRAR